VAPLELVTIADKLLLSHLGAITFHGTLPLQSQTTPLDARLRLTARRALLQTLPIVANQLAALQLGWAELAQMSPQLVRQRGLSIVEQTRCLSQR
jgi:hypothetical protein